MAGGQDATWLARPSSSAAELVVAVRTCAGVIPPASISGSSRRFWPCGPTPLSVPMAILTPAATARENESLCAAMTSRALAATPSGSWLPCPAASSTAMGAISVGTSQVPAASIMSMASSSR